MDCSGKEDYKVIRKVGRGAFGEVYLARKLSSGQLVALKRIPIRSPESGLPSNIIRELEALHSLDHNNIVSLKDVYVQGTSIVLVQEYCLTDLGSVIRSSKRQLPRQFVKGILQQILQGLRACDIQGILHRDIKPSNLLITHDGIVKLADFGLARPRETANEPCYSSEVATRWYRAPELLYGARNYTQAVDMWAVGCVFAEMLGRSPMFPGVTDIDQLAKVQSIMGTASEETWPEVTSLPDWGKIYFPECTAVPLEQVLPDAAHQALDLLSRMLRYPPNLRVSAEEALKDDYFFTHPMPSTSDAISQFIQSLQPNMKE